MQSMRFLPTDFQTRIFITTKNKIMKQILLKLSAALVMLFSFTAAYAYDFEVDGIYYNKIWNNEVEVTYKFKDYLGQAKSDYVGNVVIPSKVTKEGRTYSVTSIGESAFSSCRRLTSVAIPNSVTSIGASAFSSCSGLTSVTIPNSVKSIGDSAFEGCSDLTSVTIPNSVKSIEEEAFEDCSNLKEVSLGTGLRNIGDFAFVGCAAITKITSYAVMPPLVQLNSFRYEVYDGANVYVPQASLNDYKSDSVWKRFYNLQGAELTGINGVTIDSTANGEQKVYDLQGRKLRKPTKGLIIINGKKVLMK